MLLAFPFLAGLAIPLPFLAVAALALLAGLGIETFSVLWDTCLQQEVPPNRLSRVYGYDMLGSVALIPAGYAAVGPVADAVGTAQTLWAAFAISTVATLAMLAISNVRRLRRTAPAAVVQPSR
jgi:hypothetical protein